MENRIPVSPALEPMVPENNKGSIGKGRLILISILAVAVAAVVSVIAKFLVLFISAVTNISFYGTISIEEASPAANTLGYWVIVIPAVGGLVVGFLAYYGSSAIRGHGIPEAMEKILTNKSKIKPAITYLKPISSAIAIGTGGPFGAEGPIIATGGALGSTFGQLIKITHYERKVILAAGATAGMSAIFGTPIAAIFLAIELLLFEFSPKSLIPVALACITGAAGHHLFFEPGPVFFTKGAIDYPSNVALATYSVMGVIIGLFSVLVTKLVYFVEDSFEKLPIHWMWWPALGGLAVGLIGYFFPRTLGVGYNNITDILSGSLTFNVLLALCAMKFLSWVIALGSGTSGGTLAPLLTIGGALGGLLGFILIEMFPESGVTVGLAALVGMSAMFAGASRAFLTSIIFALETTAEANALLPLLATCGGSYIVSFMLMKNTIMTEKIARRGIRTPESYEPDLLEHTSVREVMAQADSTIVPGSRTVRDVIEDPSLSAMKHLLVVDDNGEINGVVDVSQLIKKEPHASVHTCIDGPALVISEDQSLRTAVEKMLQSNAKVLVVYSNDSREMTGTVSVQEILSVYRQGTEDHTEVNPELSITKGLKKILVPLNRKRREED